MTQNLPPPLTPPECDLRGMEWMPLYGNRLFTSDFEARASDAVFRAAARLWWMAWQQVPAASLPNDDHVLCRLAGLGRDIKGWMKLREEDALHGFIECSDGRLYHQLLSTEANDAWDRRVRDRDRKAAYRARNTNGTGGTGHGQDADVPRDRTGTDHGTEPGQARGRDAAVRVVRHVDRTGQDRTGQGQDKKERKERPLATLAPSAGAEAERDFEAFWQAFPRKVGRGAAARAFAAACRKAPAAAIIAAVQRAVWSTDPRFIPHPTTWLHGERWADEVDNFDPVLRAAGLSPADFDHPEFLQ